MDDNNTPQQPPYMVIYANIHVYLHTDASFAVPQEGMQLGGDVVEPQHETAE